MRQPLYRYKSDGHKVIDGAVFAFVQGTNPEALLVIEATNDASTPWRYALARMTGWGIEIDQPDKTTWRVPSAGVGHANSAYYNRFVGRIPGSPE